MSSNQRKSLVAAASLVAVAAILSRILGYAREVMLAAKFGASNVTDAYLVAQEIPGAVYYVVSLSLVLAFIPIYRDVLQKQGEAAAWRLVNIFLNVALIVFGVLWVIGEIGAPLYLPLLAPGFSREAMVLTISLTRAMLPMLLLVGVAGLSAAVLNAHQRFGPPAFFALASNVVVVGALAVASRPEHIHWIAYAVVGGTLLGVIIQVINLPRLGYRYRLTLDWGDAAHRHVWGLLIPVMIATSVYQVQTLSARFFASHLAEGAISLLNYAARIGTLPFTVVGMAVTTVIYPVLAEQGAAGRFPDLRETLKGGIRTLSFILVPMAVGTAIFAEPITRLMFERGAFTPDDTQMTAYALQFIALGMLFTGWVDVLNRTFYAIQDSFTPMWMAVVMIGINLVLNYFLVDILGLGGLALSSSLSPLIGSLLLLWRLGRRIGSVGDWSVGRALLSYIATSILGGGAGWWLLRLGSTAMGESGLVQAALLVVGLSLILVVHIGAAILFRTPDGDEIRRMGARVMRKIRRA